MRVYKQKQCRVCGQAITPTSGKQKYCRTCAVEVWHRQKIAWKLSHGVRVGIGKGHANISGPQHPQYKTGIVSFQRASREWKLRIGRCQRCGVNLNGATAPKHNLHHIDGNRSHNWPGNWMLLCRPCHVAIHVEMRLNADRLRFKAA